MDAARRDKVNTALSVLVAALLVALVRGPLFEVNRRVKETSDVYALPPPRELVVLSLGYTSVLADLLWAHVLVEQGLHTEARRRYDNLTRFYDAINELEPTYRDPYLFADALITFQASDTPRDEVLKARAIMERGMDNRPLDGELWLAAGEFIGFVAPGTYLTDPAEQAEWRRAGARRLARAAELGGDNSNISWQALGGAGLLSRAGERDAAIRFLQRTLAVTNDEELKDKIKAKLVALLGEERDDLFSRLWEGVLTVRHGDLSYVSRTEYMVIGPPRDPAYCAGGAHAGEAACAPSWRAWEELSEEARPAGR
jgi:hypothetical protein